MAQINLSRKSYWRTEIAAIVVLLMFVGAVELAAPTLANGLPAALQLPIGVALAVVPAALWMAVFYAQDRAEPEPRQFVVGVALLAALLAAAVGQPLLNGFFRVASWIHHDTLTELLGSVLIIGVVQEMLKFAAVRFSMYYSSEFDQRIDGVLYGTASGIGYATMLNLTRVFAAGGFADLGAGVIQIVITALAQGAIGGLIGYFLARTRFDHKPLWWMPTGILLAALLNGVFAWLRSTVSRSALVLNASGIASGGYNPLPALLLSIVVTTALSALLFILMRRAGEKSETQNVDGHSTASAVATFALATVALATGLLIRNAVETRTKVHRDPSGVQISYPDNWRLDTKQAPDGLLKVREAGDATSFELRWEAIDDKAADKDAVSRVAGNLALNRARDLMAYKTFDITLTPSGTATATSNFVYVTGPGSVLQESVPVVMLGEDRFVRKGARIYVFTFHTTEAGQDLARTQFERFVQTAVLP
ncbi:MAG: PrsW family glutamic-type intramembrane protease [Chloroflexi bacterium]|nr:PrsW family glutamic-type intramembrane protease [Chloroflexota bacterium]